MLAGIISALIPCDVGKTVYPVPNTHHPKGPAMSDSPQSPATQTRAQQLIGDFAPKLVELTDGVLFGDIWEREELSGRDRSLITVASLVTSGSSEQLRGHLARARANGLTETELKEAIIHLAFYAGWPKAMTAISVAKEVFGAAD